MTTESKHLEAGTVAYDLAQLEPVIIIDPDLGTVAEQKNAMEDRLYDSAGNRACGLSPSTQCCEIVFANLDGVNSKTYTFPETRLGVPQVSVLEEKLSVREFVQYETLRDLLSELMRRDYETGGSMVGAVKTAWASAGLSGDVLDAVERSLDETDD